MKTRKADAGAVESADDPRQFTGTVWMETLAVTDAPSRLHVARVTFAPRARTAWHTHPLGQILIAESGVGRVQKEGEPVIHLHPGDSVTIEPGERHWHGAAPDQVFAHISMQGATPEGQQAAWLEPVTDEEYGG